MSSSNADFATRPDPIARTSVQAVQDCIRSLQSVSGGQGRAFMPDWWGSLLSAEGREVLKTRTVDERHALGATVSNFAKALARGRAYQNKAQQATGTSLAPASSLAEELTVVTHDLLARTWALRSLLLDVASGTIARSPLDISALPRHTGEADATAIHRALDSINVFNIFVNADSGDPAWPFAPLRETQTLSAASPLRDVLSTAVRWTLECNRPKSVDDFVAEVMRSVQSFAEGAVSVEELSEYTKEPDTADKVEARAHAESLARQWHDSIGGLQRTARTALGAASSPDSSDSVTLMIGGDQVDPLEAASALFNSYYFGPHQR